ncbi:MAG: nucleotidyltransferase family protein [Oscillospiraceae bacterium]|nr:nucleotidyltransferase family protein [Oscillospiraceae bacterium]
MKIAGIICEYNPIHAGHLRHIEQTRRALGADAAVVCVMSGSFVQRGEPAVFQKHVRAEAAVRGGADLVLELPLPYALSSAEGFARGAVRLLDSLGVLDVLSFGSECGELAPLAEAAEAMQSDLAAAHTKRALGRGLAYAAARQTAADAVLGARSGILRSPNNLLALQYLTALREARSSIAPMTFLREPGVSSSQIRERADYGALPASASALFRRETDAGRGPVSVESLDAAMLSRLRMLDEAAFAAAPGAGEGLHDRVLRFARSEPSVRLVCEKSKTKRYVMSRIRRVVLSACLGLAAGDDDGAPPYVRVLAANGTGRAVLNRVKASSPLPILTKPAAAKRLTGAAAALFRKEASASDFYALAFRAEADRAGGREWRIGPVIL